MKPCIKRSKNSRRIFIYESLKHTGEFPIIGVNTFLNSKGSPTIIPNEVIRSTKIGKRGKSNFNCQNIKKRFFK